MSAQTNEQITELDRELIRLAQAGDIKGYVEAMLKHPVHGRLMRAFALEEDAPEYEECMKRIASLSILLKFALCPATLKGTCSTSTPRRIWKI